MMFLLAIVKYNRRDYVLLYLMFNIIKLCNEV